MRTVNVTLRLTYDPAEESHPRDWDWRTILDCDPDAVALVGGNDSDNRAYPASMRDANARLIAAAPDMLAALKSLTAVFSSSTRATGSPGYAERSGERVVIVRELGDDERDYAEVGSMYRVRFCDGTETDAFADELTPIGDRRALSLCMAAIRKAGGR